MFFFQMFLEFKVIQTNKGRR